ncbi:MAG TPA: hypothetical protein PK580_04350 [Nitrosomonas halophila]|nr:hypothetical protein [Nitrosomonas halophila]
MKTSNTQQKKVNVPAILLTATIACLSLPAAAEGVGNVAYRSAFDSDNNWERATDDELDELRGGFILPNGVRIDLNLEKIVLLNGNELFSSYFQAPKDTLLLQNGIQNLVADSVITPSMGSFIQNTLDNQQIRTITEINIEISNLKNAEIINSDHRVFTDFIMPGLQ